MILCFEVQIVQQGEAAGLAGTRIQNAFSQGNQPRAKFLIISIPDAA